MNDNIVYDISTQQVTTELPENSSKEDFNFEFIGFSADEYHQGGKPYVFYATMTQEKKQSLIDNNITIEKDVDDKKVIFKWEDIIWHFDLYASDWERYERENLWLPGRIYFVKEDNDMELITPSNFNSKTHSMKQSILIEGKTQSQIINKAIEVLQQAYQKINELQSESQSE